MSMDEVLDFVSFEESDIKNKIFMRNDIFDRLRGNEELSVGDRRVARYDSEIYSYLFLLTYLYRNCKYTMMNDLKVGSLKRVIGFNEKYKKMDFLLKENGVLDSSFLTKTVKMKEMPMMYSFKDDKLKFVSWEDYDVTGEFREMVKGKVGVDVYSNKLKAKIPIDAVYSKEGVFEEGTLFLTNNPEAIDNTHEVDLMLFFYCMTNKDLGCKAFYVYNYLNSLPKNENLEVEVSLKKISQRTNISETKLDDILHYLKGYNLIKCNPRDYVFGKEIKGSNRYTLLGSEKRSDKIIKYKKRDVLFVKDEK